MTRKNRSLTYLTISLGVLVLAIAVYAFRDGAMEQWYIRKLDSQWKEERWAAAGELQALGSGAAEDWYLSRLDSEDDEDQKRAADKLSELGTLRTIAALIEKLPEDYSSSHSVVMALSSIGGPAAPLLLQRLKKDKQEGKRRSTAYRVLVDIGSPAIPVLISALKDDSEEVRFDVVAALRDIGTASQAAIGALIEKLEDTNKSMRRNAAFALLALDPKRIEALPVLIEVLREGPHQNPRNFAFERKAVFALGRMGPAARDAIPALEEARKRAVGQGRKALNIPVGWFDRLEREIADALKKIQDESLPDDGQR